MEFKKIEEADWEKFKAIRLKGLLEDPQAFAVPYETALAYDEAKWRSKITKPDRFFFAAEEDDVYASFAGGRKIAEDNWMIGPVYTRPEFRNKGLSVQLMNMLFEEIKKTGSPKVSLMVNIDQLPAVRLYEKLGFKTIKIEKDQKLADGLLHDEYYMEKIL